MVFHWSLSDSKSPQVSRTLLSILAFLNNVVVLIVSTRPPTYKSSSCLITIVIIPSEFFTSALDDGLPPEFEGKQVSSSLQKSSQYSDRFL